MDHMTLKEIILSASNVGDRAVTLSSGALALPNGNTMFSLANNSTDPLPHELAVGKSLKMWFELKPLAASLRQRGHRGVVELRATFTDQTGRIRSGDRYAREIFRTAGERRSSDHEAILLRSVRGERPHQFSVGLRSRWRSMAQSSNNGDQD